MGSLVPPAWPQAALLVWACLWAGASGYQESWGSCDTLVCHEVQKQTEGLIRLKQMRNYILRTVQVMNNLLTSLDEEVFQTSRDIELFIGPQCPEVQPLLQKINTLEDEDDIGTTTLVQGSLEQTTSHHQTHTTTQHSEDGEAGGEEQVSPSTQHTHHHRPGVGSTGTLEVSSTQTNRDVTTSVDRTSSTDESSSSSSRDTDNQTYYSGYKLTNKFGQTVTSARKPMKIPKTFDDNSGTGGTGSGYGGADSVHTGTHSSWGSSSSEWSTGGSEGHTTPGGSGGSHGGSGGCGGSGSCRGGSGGVHGGSRGGGGSGGSSTKAFGRQCRGVPRESPHWVPGLDQWCSANCAAGYCPSTKCVC